MTELAKPAECFTNRNKIDVLRRGFLMQETATAYNKIVSGFEALPDSPQKDILAAYAYSHLAKRSDASWNDKLFHSGMALVHAKAHAGKIPGAVDLGTSIYIPDKHDWSDETQAVQELTSAFTQGYTAAAEVLPAEFIHNSEALWNRWFQTQYGMPVSDEIKHILKNPKIVSIPFDHQKKPYSFIQAEGKYPFFMDRRAFAYMKAWSFPPTWFRSDVEKNDFLGFQRMKAEETEETFHERLYKGGIHEGTELYTAPLLEMAVKSDPHCWFQEGIAQYYSTRTDAAALKRYSRIKTVDRVTSATKGVDYIGSLLLTMTAAAEMKGYSPNGIDEGVSTMLQSLSEHAYHVSAGNIKAFNSPRELLAQFLPDLNGTNKKVYAAHIRTRMKEMKEKIMSGEFV